jgi:hypothetical protein
MAFDADTVFEIRSDGNDDNGGGFYDRNPGTSVDYSQQTAAQLTLTDLAMVAFSTTLTSATGGFTAAMVGNLIHIKSGTNFTYSFFEIVGYTDTNTVTLDRTANSTGSPATGGTGSIGGALGSVGQLGEVWSTLATAGMRGYIKTGNYTVNVDSANVSGGKLNLTSGSIALRLEAYKTARGDMGVDECDRHENLAAFWGLIGGVTSLLVTRR